MATLLKVLNNLADIKSAGGVALRVRTQGGVNRFIATRVDPIGPQTAFNLGATACDRLHRIAAWSIEKHPGSCPGKFSAQDQGTADTARAKRKIRGGGRQLPLEEEAVERRTANGFERLLTIPIAAAAHRVLPIGKIWTTGGAALR
jgi:hypothetical protein